MCHLKRVSLKSVPLDEICQVVACLYNCKNHIIYLSAFITSCFRTNIHCIFVTQIVTSALFKRSNDVSIELIKSLEIQRVLLLTLMP